MNKTCPFCQCDETELQTGTEDREGTPVSLTCSECSECSECGAVGPWTYAAEGEDFVQVATKLWNERKSQ